MLSEIVNALFLTHLATEYLVLTNRLDFRPQQDNAFAQLTKPRHLVLLVVVVLWNIGERLSGVTLLWQDALEKFLHAPKILLAAVFYLVALYYDCRRTTKNLSVKAYLHKVGLAFCYVLPVYPFLAVLISCAFFILLTVFDTLKINADFLNWPIYYGTLYGPFSFVYWKVKQSVMEERSSLPSSSQGVRLGSSRENF